MAFYTPEGEKYFFSQTFGTAKTVTALTNADPAIATSIGHGLVDGNEVLLNSGWEEQSESVFKIDQITADTFGLLGLDATDTGFHPAGAGTGTVQLITNWVEIPQVVGINTSGGDQRFTDVQLLSSQYSTRIPTGFNPMSMTLNIAHDPANENYKKMLAVSRVRRKVAIKILSPGGASAYGYGYMSVSEMASRSANAVNQTTASISFIKRFISYA